MGSSSGDEESLARDFLESFLVRARNAMSLFGEAHKQHSSFTINGSISPRFNARVSMEKPGTFDYTFNLGACLSICDAAMTLSATASFCEAITGEYGNGIEGLVQVKQRYSDYTVLGAEASVLVPLPAYNLDETREHLGDVLFDLAAIVVSLHEQGHALCGHLHYLNDVSGLGYNWLEMSSDRNQNLMDQAKVWAFELQADAFAFKHLLSGVDWTIVKGIFPDSPLFGDGEDGELDWLYFVTIAAGIILSILEKSEDETEKPSRDHPPAKVRILGFFALFKQAVVERLADEEQRNQFLTIIHTNLSVVFDVIGVSPLERDAFNEYFSKAEDELCHPTCIHLKNAISTLNELSGELEVFAKQIRSESS